MLLCLLGLSTLDCWTAGILLLKAGLSDKHVMLLSVSGMELHKTCKPKLQHTGSGRCSGDHRPHLEHSLSKASMPLWRTCNPLSNTNTLPATARQLLLPNTANQQVWLSTAMHHCHGFRV